MTQLTTHYSVEDLSASSTAVRCGIDNRPPPDVVDHLMVLARGLEQVRAALCLFNGQLAIDSGYRCPRLNYKVGGASNSAHVQGYAADFTCKQYGSPKQIMECLARSTLMFDQLILEGTWVHISFAPAMRREVLTAHFGREGTTYTKGEA